MIYSNYFDLGMIMDYWGPERLNHHTEATSMLFASRECARIILEEGLDNSIARHKLHGGALLAGIQGMGLEVFGDLNHRMNNVLGVVIPQGIHGEQVRQMMLNDFSIEIGTSFGPLAGQIWRIGTMGYNARKDCVLQTLDWRWRPCCTVWGLRRNTAPVRRLRGNITQEVSNGRSLNAGCGVRKCRTGGRTGDGAL
jgi:(S)-ureidoglycine---glyoxylate transaminase